MSQGGGLRISAWAIRNPVAVAVLFVALVLAGIIAYGTLAVKQYPNLEFPIVSVTVTQSGASPAEMETQITRPVEDALAGISNVKNIYSTVTQGVSTTTLEIELGQNIQKKTDEVRSRMDQVRAQLPREIDAPTITQLEVDSQPIMTYAVAAPDMSEEQLSWFVDDTLTRALQAQKGVGQVSRVGGVEREINVVIDPERMAARGLTAPQVNEALRSFDTDAPGGQVQVGGRQQTVRVLGSVNTVAALRDLNVPTGGGRYVKLSDIADVGDGAGEVRGFARLNGRPVLGFQVMKTKEASDVDVEDRVIKALDGLQKAHKDVTFTRVFSSVTTTRDNVRATQHVLLEGMFLAALVVFLFLREWRSTLIAAVAMPVSLIPTFLVMVLFGFSLNMVTLLALTLVVGILVDDAIVEIENIEKRVAAGARPYQAAMEGADAIGLAVVATTCAIVVVFTPVSFMKGIAGQFFREFGLTVSVAVIFSLLTARLLTPLLAAYFLRPASNPHPRKPFKGFYRDALEWCLDHRILASLAGGAIFIGSLFLAPLLPQGFQPKEDPDFIYVKIQGPPGATPADMEEIAQRVSHVFAGRPEVTGTFIQIGSTAGGGGFGGSSGSDLRDGTATVLLDPHRKLSGDEIRSATRDQLRQIPDARVGFQNFQGAAGITATLVSSDPVALERTALQLEKEMRSLPEVVDPRPSAPPTAPEVVIRPRAAEAARLGVSAETIATAARVATVGDIDANVAKLTDNERRIPIRIRLPAIARADIDRIRSLRLPTASGGVTTLGAVADVDFQAGPARIQRQNRKRMQGIEAELNGGVETGDAYKKIKALPVMKALPPGVTTEETGQLEAEQEMQQSMGLAVFAGVSMIFGVLVLLFRSFFKPVVILSALPLAVGGAFLGLLAFNLSLSIPSLIGFLMLLGLAAKNSILLVEYAIERERDGVSQREALIEACRERARPIVMTSMAMAAGMLPTAFALEKGAEFRQPMAVAVIGGLITSTILSLVLVPVVYEFVDDFEAWLKPRLARLITPREAPARVAPDDRL
jgi:HAE1 family hydrophobic/amphiphilic exporter-1